MITEQDKVGEELLDLFQSWEGPDEVRKLRMMALAMIIKAGVDNVPVVIHVAGEQFVAGFDDLDTFGKDES